MATVNYSVNILFCVKPGSTGGPSVKAVIMALKLTNYPVRSEDRFLFQCVFAALSDVADHGHIC